MEIIEEAKRFVWQELAKPPWRESEGEMDKENNAQTISLQAQSLKLNAGLTLVEVDCAKQNNNYECGLNVLMYTKLVNEAYCNKMLQIPFLDWYTDVILHVNSDLRFVLQLKPASLEAGGEQSDELGWVTVQTSSKIHPSTSLNVSFEHNNPYSILSSLDESEPPCEVVGVTPRSNKVAQLS
ncbi:hypothetical protein J6590_078748 [Homalodisca vitripennis]|nr:hypothetical protein J6590_078748 [Homalodisca vitripennis]